MKLHLPKQLRSAVLACLSALAAAISPTVATGAIGGGALAFALIGSQAMAASSLTTSSTQVGDVTYSGDVYTLAEAASNGRFSESSFKSSSYDESTATWTLSEEAVSNGWRYFCNSSAISSDYTYGNTLRFATGSTQIKVGNSSVSGANGFSGMTIGGIIAEKTEMENASASNPAYWIWALGRDFIFEGNTAVNMSIEAYTMFSGGASGIVFKTGGEWNVATGTQLTFNAGQGAVGSSLSIETGKEVTIKGGGTVAMGTSDNGTFNVTLGQNSILNVDGSSTLTVGSSSSALTTLSEGSQLNVKAGSTLTHTATINASGSIDNAGTASFNSSSNIFSTITNSGTLTLAGTTTLNGTLTNKASATLTLTGTLVINQAVAVEADSTVNVDGAVFDLSSLAASVEGNVYTYTLFTGDGASGITLSLDQITGIATTGKSWDFSTGGVISYTITSHDLFWNGGDLTWDTTTGIWSDESGSTTDLAFSNEDNVTFNGTSVVTLASDIEATNMTVAEGASVTLEGSYGLTVAYDLSLSGDLKIGSQTSLTATNPVVVDKTGSLTLTNLSHFTGKVQGEGKLVLDLNGVAAASFSVIDTANPVYTLELMSGTTFQITSNSQTPVWNSFTEIIVNDGAMLSDRMTRDNTTLSSSTTIYLAGAGTANVTGAGSGAYVEAALAMGLSTTGSDGMTIGASIVLTDDATVYVGSTNSTYAATRYGYLSGAIDTAEHVFSKTGAGILYLTGNVGGKGEISVEQGSLSYGSGASSSNQLDVAAVTVKSGATFTLNHAAADLSKIALNLEGGTLNLASNTTLALGTVTVADGSAITGAVGTLTIDELTGSGTVAVNSTASATGSTVINAIRDFSGALNVAQGITTGRLASISVVDQSNSLSATIVGDVTSTDFQKLGEGSFTLNGTLHASSLLNMNYEGSLTLTAIEVAADTVLKYGSVDSTQVINPLANLSVNVVIDVLDIDESVLRSEEGYNLGLAEGVDQSLLSVLGLEAGDYTLTAKDGTLWLTLNSGAQFETEWDWNWGSTTLAKAPSTLAELSNVSGNVSLAADSSYAAGDYVGAAITGGDGSVFGGYYRDSGETGEALEKDVWIRVEGGTLNQVVGGNYCQNWDGSGSNNLTGDTHILVTGADTTVQHVIGGNLRDGLSPVFTGDSYISIKGGNILGNVIGSSAAIHGLASTQTGNTHVFVYVPLDGTGAEDLGGESVSSLANVVIGGAYHIIHSSNPTTVMNAVLNGSTNVLVDLSGYGSNDGENKTEFTKILVGGHASNVNNASNVLTISGSTNLTINGIKSDGSAVAFTENVIGGSLLSGGTADIQSSNLTIMGGSFNKNVVGGSYLEGNQATLANKAINLEITGGSVAWTVIGGHYINGSGTASLTADTGDITVSINGGEVHDVTGGTYSVRNNGSVCIYQGDVAVNLNSGSVLGDVWAAGEQRGSSGISTSSTTVAIGADIVLTSGKTISGGYMVGDETSTPSLNSSVTGNRTLSFTDAIDYTDKVAGVDFKDFDVISVAEGASVTLGSILGNNTPDLEKVTKTGAGVLALENAAQNAYDVQEGTLLLKGDSNTLTAVNVASDATLSGGSGASLGGSLTLAEGAILAVDAAGTGINLASGSTNNALTLGGKITIQLSEDVASGDYTVALLTGISTHNITFEEDELTGILYADASQYVERILAGDTVLDLSGSVFLYDEETQTLSLSNELTGTLYWEGGSGNWESESWSATDGDTSSLMAWREDVSAAFTHGGSSTLVIDLGGSVVQPANMLVRDGTYEFTNGYIMVQKGLTLDQSATATFQSGAMVAGLTKVEQGSLLYTEQSGFATGSLDNAGTLKIGQDQATNCNLSVLDGDLVNSGDILVMGDITASQGWENTGSVQASGTVTIGKATEAGGSVNAASLALANGDNSFDSLVISGAVTNTGTLTIAQSSTMGSLSGGSLTISNGTTSIGADTTLETLGGKGSLSVTGNLTVQSNTALSGSLTATGTVTLEAAAENTVGSLAANAIVLGAGSTLEVGSTLSVSEITLGDITSWNTAAVTAGTLQASSLNFTVEEDEISKWGLKNGSEIVLFTADSIDSGLTSLTLNQNGDSFSTDTYKYKIKQVGNNIVVEVSGNADAIWTGTAGATWGTDSSWEQNTVPSATASVGFFGDGDSTVTIQGSASAGGIVVDSPEKDYTFTGGSLNASRLEITQGGLTIANKGTTISGATVVSEEATLTVAEDGVLTTGSLTVNQGNTLDNKGVLSVQEALSADGKTISNTGTLSVGDGSKIGTLDGKGSLSTSGTVAIAEAEELGNVTITSGTLTVTEATTVDTLTNNGTFNALGGLTINQASTGGGALAADSLTLHGSTAFVSMTVDHAVTIDGNALLTLNGDSAAETIAAREGSVTVNSGATLSVTGAGTSQIGALSSDGTVELTGPTATQVGLLSGTGSVVAGSGSTLTANAISGSLSVTTGTLELSLDPTSSSSSYTLSSLTANRIEFNDGALGTALTLTNIELLDDAASEMIISFDTELDKDSLAGRTFDLLYGDCTGVKFEPDEALRQDILRAQLKATLQRDENGLKLVFTEREANDTWYTSKDQTEQTQDVILSGAGVYETLESVAHVIVDDSLREIDLRGVDAPDTEGILIRNLTSGEGIEDPTLSIVGDGIGQSYATLYNSEDTTGSEDLIIDGVTVNVTASDGSTLTLHDMDLDESALLVNDGANLTAHEISLTGSQLVVKEGGIATVSRLQGDADSELGGNLTVTGKGGSYAGSYQAGTTVELAKGSSQTLTPSDGLTLIGHAGSVGTLSYQGADKEMAGFTITDADLILDNLYRNQVTGELSMGSLTLAGDQASSMQGGKLAFSVIAQDAISSGDTPVAVDGALNLTGTSVIVNIAGIDPSATGLAISSTQQEGIALVRLGSEDSTAEGTSVTLNGGQILSKYFTNARLENGTILVDRNTSYYSSNAGLTENGKAGATMLDDILLHYNPQATGGNSDLAAAMDGIDALLAAGDKAAADRVAASIAGASTATLGVALSGDVERQLRAIRNRTATMGVNQCQVHENMPYVNAWVNAEGDYRELDASGTATGYTLSSWGGTVGMDLDLSGSFTMGLALTAMYGDLDTDGADVSEGDFDTYYVSLFGRYASRAWTHTFIATAGLLDGSLDRTVNYGQGSYKTSGDLEGVGFGLMYEVGYVVPLNENGTTCLQPVFNVAWRHISVDGYTEKGGDAILRVGDQDLDTVTFGLGARLQTTVGENVYNRTSILELRALLKADAGDRRGTADVVLADVSDVEQTVRTEEIGAVGVELGAGLTIPVGAEGGAMFLDASLDLRDGYSNVNATVGYRINF